MSMIEIILLVFGIIIFIVSFLIPVKKEKSAAVQVDEERIHKMVDQEVENAKEHISDLIDETVNYTMEKTERSMERLTNEKMMAINEYSDTVLEEIHKNHKEVVFLYDMLNTKQENLKTTVSQVEKTASKVKQAVKDAEVTVKEVEEKATFVPLTPQQVENSPKKEKRPAGEKIKAPVPDVTVSLDQVGRAGKRNSNERILELHKAGKSNMAIAKELGLGIGEVKLVIDLFEGM